MSGGAQTVDLSLNPLGDGEVAIWLRPDVHGARVGADLVLLDVAHDAYHCLPGAACRWLGSGGLRVPLALAENLAALGLADGLARSGGGLAASAPEHDLITEALPAATAGELLDFIVSLVWASTTFSRVNLADLLRATRQRRTAAGGGDSARLLRRALVFRALLPWSPVQGLCLFQAYWLSNFLARGDLVADWVFGVTTWPFAAHCWVQSETTVLNDSVERVGRFRPILVV